MVKKKRSKRKKKMKKGIKNNQYKTKDHLLVSFVCFVVLRRKRYTVKTDDDYWKAKWKEETPEQKGKTRKKERKKVYRRL